MGSKISTPRSMALTILAFDDTKAASNAAVHSKGALEDRRCRNGAIRGRIWPYAETWDRNANWQQQPCSDGRLAYVANYEGQDYWGYQGTSRGVPGG